MTIEEERRKAELAADSTVQQIIARELELARQKMRNIPGQPNVSRKIVDKRRKAAKAARKARKRNKP